MDEDGYEDVFLSLFYDNWGRESQYCFLINGKII